MVHGYHVIWGTYGFWLPNDPRGSWSDFIYAWELARFGETTRLADAVSIDRKQYQSWRTEAREALKYPAVNLTGDQALAVAEGFGRFAKKSGLRIWACAILPQHIHLIIGRHRYKVEQAANLLKGAATRRLVEKELHPMMEFKQSDDDRLPSMWGAGCWKVFLESEEHIQTAIYYVERNPEKEGKRKQTWSFVTPFDGIGSGWIHYP